MHHKKPILCLLAAIAVLIAVSPARAADDPDPCPPGNLIICNMKIPLPGNPVGYKAIMTIPAPYEHNTFTVECTGSRDGSFGYTVPESDKVICKLETCPAYPVDVCGYDIPTPSGTPVGESVKLEIPTLFVTLASVAKHLTVTALCSDTNGSPRYRVNDRRGSACSDFACRPAQVSVCDTLIDIPEYGENGSVREMTVPAPFVPERFRVQCLARNDKPPAYEVIEQRNVTCKKRY